MQFSSASIPRPLTSLEQVSVVLPYLCKNIVFVVTKKKVTCSLLKRSSTLLVVFSSSHVTVAFSFALLTALVKMLSAFESLVPALAIIDIRD